MRKAIIIFISNPILGKVKTRLAMSIGNEAALKVYIKLLQRTNVITKDLECEKYIFYADGINKTDSWNDQVYTKVEQGEGELGQKMTAAFKHAFNKNAEEVLIIGSDCYDLSQKVIEAAFIALKEADIVIGPAADGGYYLLGMKMLCPDLFKNINWSTDTVLKETIAVCDNLELHYFLLPVLKDVDRQEDIGFKY